MLATFLPLVRSLMAGRIIRLVLINIVRQGAWLFVFAGLGFCLFLLALAFAAQAGYVILLRSLDPGSAALAVAGGLLLLSGMAFFLFYRMVRVRPGARAAGDLSDEALDLVLSGILPAFGRLNDGLAKRAPSLMVASLCGGFIAGLLLLGRRR